MRSAMHSALQSGSKALPAPFVIPEGLAPYCEAILGFRKDNDISDPIQEMSDRKLKVIARKLSACGANEIEEERAYTSFHAN